MENGSVSFSLGGLRKATVKKRGSNVQVAIREWQQCSDGRIMAGKKGINLSVEEWCALQEHSSQITYGIKKLLRDLLKHKYRDV